MSLPVIFLFISILAIFVGLGIIRTKAFLLSMCLYFGGYVGFIASFICIIYIASHEKQQQEEVKSVLITTSNITQPKFKIIQVTENGITKSDTFYIYKFQQKDIKDIEK